MNAKWIKLLLRLSLASAFLSAVADRFGYWPAAVSVWGNFGDFLAYTRTLAPWAPESAIPAIGWLISILELILALFLLLGIRVRLTALISGGLLLIFAVSMSFYGGVKGALDYSVYTAAAAAFALSCFNEPFFELDRMWKWPARSGDHGS